MSEIDQLSYVDSVCIESFLNSPQLINVIGTRIGVGQYFKDQLEIVFGQFTKMGVLFADSIQFHSGKTILAAHSY